MNDLNLNEANKLYNEPMHTCEHILNQTMVRMFGCERSVNAHIEKRKSKCDYLLTELPSDQQIAEITSKVNEIIDSHLSVYEEIMSREKASELVDLSKLPAHSSNILRLIHIGNYDTCACIGKHVKNTSEIGRFEIISHNMENGKWRVRFKLVSPSLKC